VDLPSELAVPIGPGQVDMAGYRLTGLAVGDRVTVPARFSVISCPVFFGMPSGASGRRRSASSDSGQAAEGPLRSLASWVCSPAAPGAWAAALLCWLRFWPG
jgi:hypothetical protein